MRVIVDCLLYIIYKSDILVLYCCGIGTQERLDGTQYVLICAASADNAAEVKLIRSYSPPLLTSLAPALSTDFRRSCKRRENLMRLTLP